MTQKPQLYLHIGHPKTASSTLQAFLYKNARQLRKAGFGLPTSKLACSNETLPAANPLWTLENIKDTGDVSAIERWIEDSQQLPNPPNKLILSSESMAQKEWPDVFTGISELADIHLIYYVRRQDQLLLSAWRQWGLKRGLSLEDFLARRLHNKQPDYLSILTPWLETVQLASHHVRFIQPPFLNSPGLSGAGLGATGLSGAGLGSTGLSGTGIIEDFCTHIDFDASDCVPVANENISIDARLLLFVNQHTELFSSVHDEEIFSLLAQSKTAEPDVRLAFTKGQFIQVRDTFEPLNQALLNVCQTSRAGIAVIDEKTARFANEGGNTLSLPAQISYVRTLLDGAINPDHEKLVKLKKILSRQA
ncbi:MAG: hypothetical protein JKY57_02775 [Kordiimonadaceae bacterium]|nr:hypothetical protein [Kordiimonadaceae bacterium]